MTHASLLSNITITRKNVEDSYDKNITDVY